MFTRFVYHVSRHLGTFHLSPAVNHAAVSVSEPASDGVPAFSSLGCTPVSGNAASSGNFVSFCGESPHCSHSSDTILQHDGPNFSLNTYLLFPLRRWGFLRSIYDLSYYNTCLCARAASSQLGIEPCGHRTFTAGSPAHGTHLGTKRMLSEGRNPWIKTTLAP